MPTRIDRIALRRFAPFAAAFFLACGGAAAQDALLPRREIVKLAVLADSGNGAASKKLERQYRLCVEKKQGLNLSAEEDEQSCQPLAAILSTLYPEVFEAEGGAAAPDRVSQESFLSLAMKYLHIEPGESHFYGGQRKKLGEEQWRSGDRLAHHSLASQLTDQGSRHLVLTEQFSKDVLVQQALVEYTISRNGVRARKDIVFNSPSSYLPAPIGKQDEELLWSPASLSGATTPDGYRIVISTGGMETPVGRSSGCLVLSSLVETHVFAPDIGLVSMESFDSRWTWNGSASLFRDEAHGLSGDEIESLRKSLVRHLRKQGIYQPQILSVRKAPSAGPMSLRLSALPKEKPPGWGDLFWRIRRSRQAFQAVVLGYRKDGADGAHRRYEIARATWIWSRREGKVEWEPEIPAGSGGRK